MFLSALVNSLAVDLSDLPVVESAPYWCLDEEDSVVALRESGKLT